jgi:hypothetical protein
MYITAMVKQAHPVPLKLPLYPLLLLYVRSLLLLLPSCCCGFKPCRVKSSADISTQTAVEARRKQENTKGKMAARTVQKGCQLLLCIEGKELCRAARVSFQNCPFQPGM